MKPLPACLPCILHQALQVAREVSDDEWSQRKVLNEVLRHLPEAEWHQSSPAEILGAAIASARNTLKVRAPFKDRRAEVSKTFQGIAEGFRERLAEAEDPFALMVTAATAANLVDELVFDRFALLDPKGVFEAALGSGFASGSVDELREAVGRVETIAYLLDNAGEVLFDAILIEELRRQGKKVIVAVRGGGLLHDATLEDAVAAGLGETPIDMRATLEPDYSEPDAAIDPTAGGDADNPPGAERPLPELIELPHGDLGLPNVALSTEVGAAIEQAQLVIAKGSANYQTLSVDCERIHLLRAKCPPVAKSLGVPRGSLVLLRVKAPEVEPVSDSEDAT